MQQRYKTPTTTPKASGSQPIDHGSSASSAFNILFPESPTTATMISEILSEKTFYDSQQKTIDYFEKTGGMNSKPSDEPSYPDIQKDSITTLDEDIAALQAVGKEIESMQLKQITPRTSQLFRTDTPTTSRSMSSEPFSEQTFSESTELELSAEKPIMVGTSKENNRTPPNFKMRTPVKSNVVRSGFFSLDEPSGGLVMDYHGPCDPCGPSPLAQCIELLVSPLLRRRRPQDGEQLVTPRGLKNAAIVTLQSRWRSHRAEISLVSKLIDSWNIELRFGNSQFDRMIVPHSRVIAIANAIKNVDCWWILDGLQIQGDFINMSWQREVDVGFCNHYDGLQILDTVRVSLFVRARRNIATNSWSRRKLALLFAKAGLEKALQEEVNRRDICAVERIQRWVRGIQKDRKQSDAAITIQNWIRNVQRVSTEIQRPPTTIVLSPPKAPLLRNNYATTYSTAESLLQLTTLEARMHKEFPNTTTGSPKRKSKTNDGNKAQQHHAAVSIQNCFRMWALNSALSESSEPKVELQRALVNVGSPAEKQLFSELAEARDVPRIFSENEQWYQLTPTIQSDSFQRWHPTGNPIERRAASLAIHNIVRAYLMGLRKYRRKKKVILIQSTWRRYRACQKFAMQRFAVLVIQFAWNNYKYAQQCKENAIKIQRRWRFILRQRMFLILQFSATVLQASWRKTMAKRRFVAILRVAVWCQRAIRGYPVRQEFLAFRSAVLSLQRVYRQKCVRDVYQLQSSRAVVIQAYWRRASAKKKLVLSIHAIVRLQRMLRGLSTCRRFHYRRQQVIGIQQAWRRYSKWKLERLMESSALVIQTKWRSALARQKWESTLFSARCLQSVARGHLCRTRVSLEKKSATLVEAKWRSFSQKKLFLLRMRNIIALQTWYRGVHTRASFKKTFVASIQCQRVFRGFSQRKEYIRMRKASVQIQKNFLCWMTMKNFARGKNAAVVIQKYWRKNIAQNYLARSILLAINLQRLCRGFVERKKVHNRMAVIIRIQKAWRLYDTNKRVSLARKQLQATCLIQKSVRGFIQRRHLQRLRAEATVVQAIWRGAVFRSAYTTVRAYTIMIQSCMRGFLHRKRLCRNQDAAIQVERIWRGALARQKLESMVFSARCLQSVARGHLCRTRVSLEKKSATLVEAKWRSFSQKKLFLLRMRNIIALQTWYRGVHTRASFKKTFVASIQCQRVFRGFSQRKEYIRMRKASVQIQKNFLCWMTMKNFARGKNAAVVIQKYWRKNIAQNYLARSILLAINLQRLCRGFVERKKVHNRMAVIIRIQKAWRLYDTNKRVSLARKQLQATCLIQKSVRGFIQRRHLQRLRAEATVVQAIWRGAVFRSAYTTVRAYTIMIQSCMRGFLHRKRLCRNQDAAIQVERIWRGALARSHFQSLRNEETNACAIQRSWRTFHAKNEFFEPRCAAVVIQSQIRRYQAVESLSLQKRSERMGAIVLQNAWRTYVAREQANQLKKQCILSKERNAAAFRLQQEHSRRSQACMIIQACWRGSEARENYSKARISVETIQLLARTWLASRALSRRVLVCRRIQALARGRQAYVSYRRRVSLIVHIQKHWRSSIARDAFAQNRAAAITIGASVRGYLVRRRLEQQQYRRAWLARSTFRMLRYSAVTVQALARGNIVRRALQQERTSKTVLIDATLIIQKHWRASLPRSRYLIVRASLIMIQTLVRGSFTRRRLQKKIATAIILQRIWRGESCRLSISRLRNRKLLMLQTQEFASVTIQSIWRMHHHRSAFWSSRGAATRIQVFARHVFTLVQIRLARQLAKRTFVVEHFAASRIQKFWRHVLVNKQFTSACDIQTITRGHHCHRGFENARSGVIRIQSVWRRAICRVKIQLKNDAAVRIQAFWWGAYTREKYKIKTVFILQALTHRHAASLQLKSTITSSTYIQSAWRRWKSVKDFKASKSVIIFIQKHWRASVARNHFLITRSCAVMIQSAFRRTLVLMVFWFMRLPKEERIHVDNAARTIQIAFFHWKMQLAVCEMQSWLIILQRSIIRGQLVRSAARFALAHMNLSLRSSALEYMARLIANANPDIVSTIIAWNRSVAGAHESAAIVIQSAGRRMIARNIVRSHFDVTFDVSILVDDQMVEKERKAASLIQKTFRGQFLKVRDAAIFIQSSWRGTRAARCSRQPSIRSEKVDAIAKVLERAEIVSENRTAQLLSGSGSGDLFGPCLLRLANRVRSATADETAFSASPLPYFAVAILGNNEATRNGKTEGTIFTTCSPVRTKPQISIQTEEHSPVSPSENESLSLRKTSTPVTCNKTPSREGFGNAVDIFSPVRILNLRPEHTDRTVDRTVVKEMSAVAKSKHDSGQSTTLRGVEGLASQAQWLPSEGRKEMRINAIQPVVPILKSIDTTKTAPVRKKSQKTANTPINVQLGPKNPKIDSNLAKESNVGRGQGGAISGSLFGDSEELLSPIKKKVSDWDWADKW